MKEKIGVFLCSCSGNLERRLDLDALERELNGFENVSFIARHDLLCAADGIDFFSEQLKKHNVKRAVVAACSPRDHGVDFAKGMENAGLNKYLLQMANIREHCAWVTSDPKEALTKARPMVKSAIHRVLLHESLEPIQIECLADIVVIGGGIAGIEAAILASGAGRKVTLVDHSPSIGGRIARLEQIAPSLECSSCMMDDRLSVVDEAVDVEILTLTEITKILGYFGNFEIHAQVLPRYVNADLCMGCDDCIQACPAQIYASDRSKLNVRKAISIPFPGAVPNSAVIDKNICLNFQGENCDLCAKACAFDAIDFDQTSQSKILEVGSIILATGSETFDPRPLENLGIQNITEVYSLEDFELLLSTTGPTEGRILKQDGEVPKSIAFIHCVGRSQLGYCSGYCCQAAVKCGYQVRQENPDIEISHLYIDLVFPGKAETDLLEQSRQSEISFIPFDSTDQLLINEDKERLIIQIDRPEKLDLRVEMVVLVSGLIPNDSVRFFENELFITKNQSGFPAPDHPVLRAAQSSVEGIYLAGTISGPKTAAESITTAQAAAGTVLSVLHPGKLHIVEPTVAWIRSDMCSGCKICVSLCPYCACEPDEESGKVLARATLCQGCGICAASCPTGAAESRHFLVRQLDAEISGVLDE